MRHFIIKTGFEIEDFIEIDETELEKALYCQMSGKVGVFNNGSIRGSNIISVKEDRHKAMGWNRGYVMTLEDLEYSKEKMKEYNGVISEAKSNINHLLETGRPELIGKRQYQKIESPVSPELQGLMAGLTESKRIN